MRQEHSLAIISARTLYNPSLPYHNFHHVEDTLRSARKIVQRCKEEGLHPKEHIIFLTLLYHDAGYEKTNTGFKTKEDYAAHLAEKDLKKIGYSPNTIYDVKSTILATHRDANFTTLEEKIVRASDLAGIASSYKNFARNNANLKTEAEMLSHKVFSWAEWKVQTQKILDFYLRQDIRLTKGYADAQGNSIFHTRARKNLKRFLADENFSDVRNVVQTKPFRA